MSPMLMLAFSLQTPRLSHDGLHGYINASVQTPPAEFRYGVSLYSTAWPLLSSPVNGFQIGLASTWILPDNRNFKEPLVPHGTVARDQMPERGPSFWTVFQTIEGGLGFWTSNRYFAPTAKFRMNGSIDGYNHEVATPGWDFYGKALPAEYMGIAQLSPRLLIPPDGVTLAPDTCGELFGYAWMALPLLPSHDSPVKTGNQCWTAFLNTANFRGPIAFYIPAIWSKMSQNYATAVGRGLDTLPGIANSGAIEIGGVPQLVSDKVGDATYHRIPQLQFPVDGNGQTVLMHKMTTYSKQALWDQVESWMKGGPSSKGQFNASGAFLPKVTANPMRLEQGGKTEAEGLAGWVGTKTIDDQTFGLEWNPARLTSWKKNVRMGQFPDYFRHEGKKVEAVLASAVPAATGLSQAKFPSPDTSKSYEPSDGGKGPWTYPGPKAGPFTVKLADHSTVTYYWYRFVDQPSMQNAGLSAAEKIKLQAFVEKIHREWTPDKEYMAPPAKGQLASLDSALLVKPPKGLEVGYVPVAIRQDPTR